MDRDDALVAPVSAEAEPVAVAVPQVDTIIAATATSFASHDALRKHLMRLNEKTRLAKTKKVRTKPY